MANQYLTNIGKRLLLEAVFRAQWNGVGTLPTYFYCVLFEDDDTPATMTDYNTLSQFAEITAGGGYSAGGVQLTRGTADFDYINEDDANNKGELQLDDVVFSASGGSIPNEAAEYAHYAGLTDDNATVASRLVICFWDLESGRKVTDTQDLTLQNCEIELTD